MSQRTRVQSPTLERVSELLAYDPGTGILTRRVPRGGQRAGAVAGNPNSWGYLLVGIDGRQYSAHRIAWLLTHGSWPGGEIDHINGDRTDNRIANLREATVSENQQNQRGPQANNASGYLGVYWNKQRRQWRACIRVDGRTRHLGGHDTAEAAHAAYLAAKRALHPFGTI